MAVTANSIVTPQAAVSRVAICTTADVAWQLPVNVQTLIDDATNANGIRLTSLIAIMRATVASSINCAVYRKVATTYTLIDSALLLAATPSASVANGKLDFGYSDDNPLILEAGVGLVVAIGTSIANGIVFRAHGGAY